MSSEDVGQYRVVSRENTRWFMERKRRREVESEEAKERLRVSARIRELRFLEWDGNTPCRIIESAVVRWCVPEMKRLLLEMSEIDRETTNKWIKRFANVGEVDLVDWVYATIPWVEFDRSNLLLSSTRPSESVLRLILTKYKDRLESPVQGSLLSSYLAVWDAPLIPDVERAGEKSTHPYMFHSEDVNSVAELARLRSEGRPRGWNEEDPLRVAAITKFSRYRDYRDYFLKKDMSDASVAKVLTTGNLEIIDAMIAATCALIGETKTDEYGFYVHISSLATIGWPIPLSSRVFEHLCDVALGSDAVADQVRMFIGHELKYMFPMPVDSMLPMMRLLPTALDVFRPIDLKNTNRKHDLVCVGAGTRTFNVHRRYDPSGSLGLLYAQDTATAVVVLIESVRLALKLHEIDQGSPYRITRAQANASNGLDSESLFYSVIREWVRDIILEHNEDATTVVACNELMESMIEEGD